MTVNYSAAVTATCTYSNGATGSCAVPSGTISYETDGADNDGNYTYLSVGPYCAVSVGGSTASDDCEVTATTYGDEFITATYTSSSAASTTETSEVQLVAPTDLAVGFTYSPYGNITLDDCTFASAADWIETTFDVTPNVQDTINAYWQAEDEYNDGADVGLTATQFFDFWQTTGIDGTYLTGTTALSSDSEVESYLSSNYVLIAEAELPAGFPAGSDVDGGGHQWLLVGYSSYGPMIVTWGQEIQISWSDFDSWTIGVWVIGSTSP